MLGIGIGDGGASFYSYGDGRLLTGAHALVITPAVLMVVCPGHNGAVAFLECLFVKGNTEDYFGCGTLVTAATSTAGRDGEFGYNGALAAELYGHCAVIVLDDIAAEQRPGFKLGHLLCDDAVLHRIGAVGVETVVHLHLVDDDADISSGIGCLFLAVDSHATHGVFRTVFLHAPGVRNVARVVPIKR